MPGPWSFQVSSYGLLSTINTAATGAQGPRLCCTARAVACPSLTIAFPIPTPPASLLGAAQELGGGWFGEGLAFADAVPVFITTQRPASRLGGTGASWHLTELFPPGRFAHKVLGAAAYKSPPLLTARHRAPPAPPTPGENSFNFARYLRSFRVSVQLISAAQSCPTL